MITMTFHQCLNLTYDNLTSEEQIIGVSDNEIEIFKRIFAGKLFELASGKAINFEHHYRENTYGLESWQNYYTFHDGVYRKKIMPSKQKEATNNRVSNLLLLRRDLVKEGFSDSEIETLINETVYEFFNQFREIHQTGFSNDPNLKDHDDQTTRNFVKVLTLNK